LHGFRKLPRTYQTPELGIVTICFDFEARARSYELIALEAR